MNHHVSMANTKFIIVVTMYNMAKWIEKNIHMLQAQTYKDFFCVIVDDLSTDNELAARAIKDDPRFVLRVNIFKKFKMRNTCEAIAFANPDDEDVVVIVDADDSLAHGRVLEKLARIYNEEHCWMTYGSYRSSAGAPGKLCRPYAHQTIVDNSFRKERWRATHLKTFKYKLWWRIRPDAFTISEKELRHHVRQVLFKGSLIQWLNWRRIELSDLLDSSGMYIRSCDDKAMMFPMLEMAGERIRFIDEISYIYTVYEKDLQYGKSATARIDQRWYSRLIRSILKNKDSYIPVEKGADNYETFGLPHLTRNLKPLRYSN